MKLHVENIDDAVTEEKLAALFKVFGVVSDVHIVPDHYEGGTKGYGFVDMPNRDEAFKAMSKINNVHFLGKALKVSVARDDW